MKTFSERLRELGVRECDPGELAFPYTVAAHYSTSPVTLRFGTFLALRGDALNAIIDALRLRGEAAETIDLFWLHHQAGGHATRQRNFLATPIEITPGYEEFVSELCSDYYYAARGHFYPYSDRYQETIEQYYARLEAAGLDTPQTYKWPSPEATEPELMEGIYPIIATPSNLGKLVQDAPRMIATLDGLLPGVLSDGLMIYILAENSD